MACVEIAGERVELRHERALWWPGARTLFVADVHLGKPSAFGAGGVPVPGSVTDADLARLDSCLRALSPKRVVVLGDLLHARSGRDDRTMNAARAWCTAARSAAIELVLVRGNHDEKAGDPPSDWGFRCVDAGEMVGPFELRHEPLAPASTARGHALCGHIHPVVTLGAPGCRPERARCFLVGPAQTMLPAFGSFTGGAPITPAAGERVFAVGDESVIEVPRAAIEVRTRPWVRRSARSGAPGHVPRD